MDAALLANHLLEGPAIHILHDDVSHLLVDAHIQEVHDILMGHLRGGFGLATEPAHEFHIGFILRPQNLDRYDPIRFYIQGSVHDGHAARADDSFNAVPAR